MKYRSKYNSRGSTAARGGFTLVEVAAAMVLLSLILTSVTVMMNRYLTAVMDMRLREEAFELARSNMESLLSEARLSEISDFGTSEVNPSIEWGKIVEPFYEPVTNRMWIRAICTAEYMDSEGEYQEVELEHWITSLTAAQIKQILAQQEVEEDYLKLLQDGQLTDIEKTTRAFLEQQQLDVDAYDNFREKQRRQKLEHLSKNGMTGWDAFLKKLEEEENAFLEKLGLDFDIYNEFAAVYVPSETGEDLLSPETEDPFEPTPDVDDPLQESPDVTDPDKPKDPDKPATEQPEFDWSNVPPELVPLIEKLLKNQKP